MKKTMCALAVSLLVVGPALAVDADPSIKLKLAGYWEGPRDLGLLGRDNTAVGYLDAEPALHLQFSADFASYFRIQGFVPSSRVFQTENGVPVRERAYGALREFWFEYGGITEYPGEVLRLGLQRVRQPDGLWYDRDIEALRWIFDTTLLQAQVGAAQQFSSYRTDKIKLPSSQKDRAYGFADIAGQWTVGHFLGMRAAYAADHGNAPAIGATPTPDDKLQDRKYIWLGAHADNGYFAIGGDRAFSYWAEVIGLFGNQDDQVLDPVTGAATGATVSSSSSSVCGDTEARFRVSQAFPLQLGAGYAYGGGGHDANGDSKTFHQTGLQSNRSRFTGTRSLINRFNEALQADLSNLSVYTAYVSLPLERWDASLVGHKFRRNDVNENIVADGLDVDPTVPSHDIGVGADLVVTRYFEPVGKEYTPGEDVRDNVRIRASAFRPGDAYGNDLKDQYQVVLETTLWF